MPELPEVETVRRGLVPVAEGVRIAAVAINRPDLRFPFPEGMAARLEGVRIERLRRRSKYLLADLDSGETLLVHLGMSGRILISGEVPGAFHHGIAPVQKHDHVVLDLENGARLIYNDPRRFGAMDLLSTATQEQHPMLARLGPEPLGNGFHEAYLQGQLARRKAPIKTVLLDQHVVAGLGNIYVCEALYDAGISPLRPAANISHARAAGLVPAIREVLERAIAAGGSSLRDYRRADGELGYFQHSFRTYGREGDACLREGCGGTIRRITQSGRSSFYCAQCQR